MLNILLFEPEIPPNTGNIIRLCANAGAALHLIEPLGFNMSDKSLLRAGLDYHEFAPVQTHSSWEAFKDWYLQNSGSLERIFGFSTKAKTYHSDIKYSDNDVLMFGPESRGLPENIRDELGVDQLVILPMKAGSRSLNLSNSAAIALYHAWYTLDYSS